MLQNRALSTNLQNRIRRIEPAEWSLPRRAQVSRWPMQTQHEMWACVLQCFNEWLLKTNVNELNSFKSKHFNISSQFFRCNLNKTNQSEPATSTIPILIEALKITCLRLSFSKFQINISFYERLDNINTAPSNSCKLHINNSVIHFQKTQ